MDPRIEQIERTQIYGLFDTGVLIYVGATKLPLRKRLNSHRSEAGSDPPIHQYLDSQIDNLHEDLEIRRLPEYETEQEALDELGSSVLNHDASIGPRELKHDWASDEVDRVEELIDHRSITQIANELEIPWDQIHNAAIKLGLIKVSSRIDWERWDDKLGTMFDRALAEMIGCAKSTVHARRVKLNISPHGRIDWEKWDQFLGEIPDTRLAEKIGCTKANVRRRREKQGVKPHTSSRRLTDKQVLEIRVRHTERSEDSYRSLADEFDVGSSTIGQAARGGSHQHLPMPEDLTEEEKEEILEQSHNR